MNETKWTLHRVTMPEDKALEYLDKLLAIVNKQFLDPGFPIALGMAIDKMRTPAEPENKALTVETNADRIRAMSHEELAEFIRDCESAGYLDGHITPKGANGYHMDTLDWLSQPEEEE